MRTAEHIIVEATLVAEDWEARAEHLQTQLQEARREAEAARRLVASMRAAAPQGTDIASQVREHIRKNGPSSRKAVASALGIQDARRLNVIAALVLRGELVQLPGGLYGLPLRHGVNVVDIVARQAGAKT